MVTWEVVWVGLQGREGGHDSLLHAVGGLHRLLGQVVEAGVGQRVGPGVDVGGDGCTHCSRGVTCHQHMNKYKPNV